MLKVKRMNKIINLKIVTFFSVLLSMFISSLAIAADYFYSPLDQGIFFGLSGLICGLIIVIWIVFILIAIWVYKDAEKRGSSGVLWLIIVILTGNYRYYYLAYCTSTNWWAPRFRWRENLP